MNTDVVVEGAPDGLRPWFQRVEGLLSRFDPQSSLSALNRKSGEWVVVPPLLYRAVEVALQAAAATGGAFDPTILDALEAAGYSRSFELGATPPTATVPAGRWSEIRLDPHLRAVKLPPGVRIDLGGIGKGLAVDGALMQLKAQPRALVNAGGDLALKTAPDSEPYRVDVEDPFHPEKTLVSFRLHRGAVATSSTLGRRWGSGLHHLIDPTTGRPSASGIVAATVVAGLAARADVLAKAAILLGAERGLALLTRDRVHGILITEKGEQLCTPGMEEYFDATA